MDGDNIVRYENEIALLEAIYPDEVAHKTKFKEIQYSRCGASLLLRLPDSYPALGRPEIISATSPGKIDLRDRLKDAVEDFPIGEEALDAFINAFREILATVEHEPNREDHGQMQYSAESPREAKKQTVIIWLHHLLNTNKRKLALSPSDSAVSGISKPGYPGVLIFSGPAPGVEEHVNVLKQQNWAAFQVRYEDAIEWEFEHGCGVKELESMGEVAKDVGDRKGDFLEAMRMR